MEKIKQKWNKIEVPKLCPEVKKKNGKSSRKLTETIDALDDHLETMDDVKKVNKPTTASDSGT